MSSAMQCFKCGISESLLYVCCNESEPICYGCSKAANCTCGKKINKAFSSNNNSKSAIKIPKIITCYACREIIDQIKHFLSFTCSHFLCISCICKAVQNKLKFQNWPELNRSSAQRYLECSCFSRTKQDTASFLKDHCFCCGEDFRRDKKIELKYGLAIRDSCRRRILYDLSSREILKPEEILKITRTCKYCSNLIDGETRTVGIEQYGDFQCTPCYNRSKGVKVEQKNKQETCASCDNKYSIFNLILVDGFYLCQACLRRSKNSEEQNKIKRQKQNEVLMRKASQDGKNRLIKQASKCISCDKEISNEGGGQDKISCDKCLKEHIDLVEELSKSRSKDEKSFSSSSLKSSAKDKIAPASQNEIERKNKYGINLEEQVKSELKKKASLDESSSKVCINCNHHFQQQVVSVESQISSLLCAKCINENISVPPKRSFSQSISPPSQIKSEQIKYRSPQQLENWRKTASYKQFLSSREIFIFNPSVGGQGRVEGRVNWPQAKRAEEKEVMYSVIQEFPNKDLLQIAPPHPRTADCGHCGYKLSRDQTIQYRSQIGKQWQLCLGCFLLCQAKNM